jgi:hypothetical protein
LRFARFAPSQTLLQSPKAVEAVGTAEEVVGTAEEVVGTAEEVVGTAEVVVATAEVVVGTAEVVGTAGAAAMDLLSMVAGRTLVTGGVVMP